MDGVCDSWKGSSDGKEKEKGAGFEAEIAEGFSAFRWDVGLGVRYGHEENLVWVVGRARARERGRERERGRGHCS